MTTDDDRGPGHDEDAAASRTPLEVDRSDFEMAIAAVVDSDPNTDGAAICRATGEVVLVIDPAITGIELPDDLDDSKKYLWLPSQYDLDLGRKVALRFASERMPDDYQDVRDGFSRRGGYRRFKTLLERRRLREAWFSYEDAAVTAAFDEWREFVGIVLVDRER